MSLSKAVKLDKAGCAHNCRLLLVATVLLSEFDDLLLILYDSFKFAFLSMFSVAVNSLAT